ncbi:MAG TPA: uracil-DNA glycosylase [Bryobacterales bacterium]|nr:uracil-DNA glycosylase [Bryobacterales bacterium]
MPDAQPDPARGAMRDFDAKVVSCERCPRLRQHCLEVAQVKRRAFRDWTYWGRPVPSFGDAQARLLIIGLAPAAHGANRTGRMFTGDSSGDFLYRTLYETGFASQPVSTHRGDGLVLRDAYITAAAHCAPPGNKPTREEFELCRPYLEEEIELLLNVKVVIVLGRLALDTYLKILLDRGQIERRSTYAFGHAARHRLPSGLPNLLCSFHPSRQNTQTGRLTPAMFLQVFRLARRLIDGKPQE